MKKYYYDLHIHSCLSPCGDDEATPDSIAGMGELNGLDIMALTDHNTVKNCPAFFEAAMRHGITPVAGMELTTAEDIHLVCLFPGLDEALGFGEEVERHRILIANRTDIFGNQLICDSEDNVTGTDEFLLSNATSIALEEAPSLAEGFGGICYPAHIDRQANGIIAVLGSFPVSPDFSCAELHDSESFDEYSKLCAGKKLIINSDAHYLWDIKEKREYIELPEKIEGGTELIKYLRGTL